MEAPLNVYYVHFCPFLCLKNSSPPLEMLCLHPLPSKGKKYHAYTKQKNLKKCLKITGNMICLHSDQVWTRATGSMLSQGGWATQWQHWPYMDMSINRGQGYPVMSLTIYGHVHIWSTMSQLGPGPYDVIDHTLHPFNYLSGRVGRAVIQEWQVAGVLAGVIFFFFLLWVDSCCSTWLT